MRYKIVPPVRDVAFLRSVADALPRVPNSVEDCCTRIRDRTELTSRDQAREYLTFCQALGLAAEDDGAYFRAFDPPPEDELADAFVENVLGAREALETIEDASSEGAGGEGDRGVVAGGEGAGHEGTGSDHGAASVDEIFEDAVEPLVPRWERNQGPEWEDTWRERTKRLCEWAVVFGLVEQVDGSYRAVVSSRSGEE